MARPRLPDELHVITGAWDKNPNRRRTGTPKSENPFGNPPKYFAADEKKCWKEILENALPGVLTGADRWVAETACIIMAKMRRRENMHGNEMSLLVTCLSKLGMTPVDRTRLSATPDKKDSDNPYAEFVN